MLSGGITPHKAVVTIKSDSSSEGKQIRIVVSQSKKFDDNLIYSGYKISSLSDNYRILKFHIENLTENTTYYYRAEIDNKIFSEKIGSFTTFPEENTPTNFKIAFSCGNKYYPDKGITLDSAVNTPVWDNIKNENPLFFLHTGDFHYGDLEENNFEKQKANYESRLTGKQAYLYQTTPLVYMWDDHDFGPNNSGRFNPAKEVSHKFYRLMMPHYPLAGADTTPIYQAFTVGRVRFIITDLRTESDPSGTRNAVLKYQKIDNLISFVDEKGRTEYAIIDSPEKTQMGKKQKEWFKQELLKAKDKYGLIVWVSTRPWIGIGENTDQWFGYSYERREIAKFIHENNIDNLCFISGDMHGSAIDDGSNNGYYMDTTKAGFFATTNAKGFPVFQAASLTSNPSVKGGPWSHGASPRRQQYGIMEVIDHTDSLKVVWTAKTPAGIAMVGGNTLKYEFWVK